MAYETKGETMKKWEVGNKVYFDGEKQGYTVKAFDGERFAICTKPFNPKRTVIYTIVDLYEGIRGTNNLIFNIYDYAVQADIDRCLQALVSGEVGISRRNQVYL